MDLNPITTTRKIDQLGRVVIPAEARRMFDMAPDDEVEFMTDGDHLVLEKTTPKCVICGRKDSLVRQKNDKHVCTDCLVDMGLV